MKQLLLTLALLGIACLQPSSAAEKAADPKVPAKPAAPQLQVFTSMGNFTIELNPERAPLTVTNILAYVDSEHYTNTLFHRVVANFVIQGGGLTGDMSQKKTRQPIRNEATNGLKNERGSLSMARTNDVNSATSQFFVNLKDNEFLDHKPGSYGYAVFGRVKDGMDDVPLEPVIIKGITEKK